MVSVNGSGTRRDAPVVLALLAVGLVGHLVAAWANGGGSIAYVHHLAGFLLIAAATGAVIGGLAWIFWRAHRRRALLILAAVQAVAGVLVMLDELRK